MGNCESCGGCGGGCSGCGGCARELTLTPPELEMLYTLSQVPFLPVARSASDMTPVYLEDGPLPAEQWSAVLTHLEWKGLIDLDYRAPLSGFDYAAYGKWPVHGSIALTARGQTVLDMIELQGFTE